MQSKHWLVKVNILGALNTIMIIKLMPSNTGNRNRNLITLAVVYVFFNPKVSKSMYKYALVWIIKISQLLCYKT